MTTTLSIVVNYSSGFSFSLSYDDDGTTYVGSVADGGTVAFVNDGHYTLTNESNPEDRKTFIFDAVSVTLGTGLTTSCLCNCAGTFSVSNIGFPKIPPGESSQEDAWTWCQAYTTSEADSGAMIVKFEDPQLGLSNNTGGTQISVSSFQSPCTCECTGSCTSGG